MNIYIVFGFKTPERKYVIDSCYHSRRKANQRARRICYGYVEVGILEDE